VGEFLLSGLAYLDVVVLVLQVPIPDLDFSTPTNNPFWGKQPYFFGKKCRSSNHIQSIE
jgi:hypothetical protein